MRFPFFAFLAFLLAACGPGLLDRCWFESCGPSGGTVSNPPGGGGGGGGAETPVTNWSFTKLTTDSPVFQGPPPGSGSCGQFLVHLGVHWNITTFSYNGRFYFMIPCKYTDAGSGGWHTMFAHWAPGEATSITVDADPSTPATIEPSWNRFTNVGGHADHATRTGLVVQTEGNNLEGYIHLRRGAGSTNNGNQYVVNAADFSALNPNSYDPTTPNPITHHRSFDLLYEGGRFYHYWWDNVRTITLSVTSDLVNREQADTVITEDYSRPHLFRYGSYYYMVAYSIDRAVWEVIRGTSYTDWDFAGAQDLNLRSYRGTGGAWDEDRFTTLGANGEPQLAGVRVMGTTLYVFYVAGDFGHGGTSLYNTPAGIGILTKPLP